MTDTVARYRTTAKPRATQAQRMAYDLPDEYEFDLALLPGPGTYRYLQERAAREGVTVTGDLQQFNSRAIDEPTTGMVALMPEDERDGRDGKPLALLDFRRGQVPLSIVGAGAYHLDELVEMANEARHYGTDKGQRQGPAPDMNELWQTWVELKRDHDKGRKRFGFAFKNTEWIPGVV